MNSSLPALGPRIRNSLITMPALLPPPGDAVAPVNATTALPLLLVMFSVAFFAPEVVGANATWTVVAAPAASVVAAGTPAEYCDAPVPVIVNGGVSVNGSALTFVMVTVAIAEPPMVTVPKSIDEGEAESAGAPAPMMSASERGST